MNSRQVNARSTLNNPLETMTSAPLVSASDGETTPRGATGSPFRFDANHQNHPIFWMQSVSSVLTIAAEPGTSAKALLSEIAACAERLVARGETSSIDLRFLKSMPDERATLLSLLGRGEVSAVVESIGRSEIQETAIPCVWLVRHLNGEDETVSELIEIADIPELLVGDRESVALGLDALRARQLSGAC